MRLPPLVHAALAASWLLLPACGDGETPHGYEEVRDRATPRHRVPASLGAEERLGFRRMPGDAAHAGMDPAGRTDRPSLAWTTPEGWEEKPGSGLREASWTVRGQAGTDASLILLEGGGGDAASNVNRWRGQMGLPPLAADAVEALPRKPMLGRQALYVDIEGTWKGGMGEEAATLEDARMLALLLQLPGVAVFLKLTGPDAVVAAEAEAFAALGASIRVAEDRQPPPPGGEAAARDSADLTWDIPDGWAVRPAKPMRLVTVGPEDAPKVECYVSILAGDAGGLEANVNRWRGQMGRDPLSAEEIGALERIEVLGTRGVLMRIEGDFSGIGAGDQQGAALYGMVAERAHDVVFAKMIGPADAMKGQYDRFVAFCKSIREAP